MKNKLFTNTIYLYLLTFAKVFFPFVTLPYLTRVLSVDTYGCVTYVKAFVSYIQLAIDYGFLLSATKKIAHLYNNDNRKLGVIIGNTLIEKSIIAFVMGVITLFLSISVPVLRENFIFTWLYFIAICVNVFLLDYVYRGVEKMEYIAIPYITAKLLTVVLTLLLIKGDKDLLFIPVFEIIGNVIASLISLGLLKKLRLKIYFGTYKEWVTDLKESGVYFLSNVATTFFGALTTIVAGIYLNLEQVSFWGLAMQIVSVAKSMYTPITNSIYPYMIKNRDLKLISKIRNLMFIPMLLGSLVVIFFGEKILMLIAGESYGEAGTVLKFLLPVIIVSFYSMLYGWPVLGAIGKVRETTLSTMISAMVQVFGFGILIISNSFTLYTLALSCCVAETTLLVVRYYIFVRNKKEFVVKQVDVMD